MSSSSSESIKFDTPGAPQTTLPASSREIYNRAYDSFIAWQNEFGMNNFSEDVFIAYFKGLAETKQPSTLYSTYSMLKATVNANNEINIENYKKLNAYLKETAKGFKSKKTKVFTRNEIDTFLKEAPDRFYLCLKVVLILGVHGACRAIELMNITVDDIERHSEQLMLVKLEDLKSKSDRSFVLRGLNKDILEKYLALRPTDIPTKRILIRYANGRCFKQVIGRNRIAIMPAQIAEYLNLPNPKLYTGHCFRRTALMLSSHLRRNDRISSELKEVYIEVPMEMEAANANEDNLIADNMVKVERLSDLQLPSPQSVTSEPCEVKEKRIPTPEKCSKTSETPPTEKEEVHKIGSAKVTITQNTNETKTISIPSKNITIVFENCENVSNININF